MQSKYPSVILDEFDEEPLSPRKKSQYIHSVSQAPTCKKLLGEKELIQLEEDSKQLVFKIKEKVTKEIEKLEAEFQRSLALTLTHIRAEICQAKQTYTDQILKEDRNLQREPTKNLTKYLDKKQDQQKLDFRKRQLKKIKVVGEDTLFQKQSSPSTIDETENVNETQVEKQIRKMVEAEIKSSQLLREKYEKNLVKQLDAEKLKSNQKVKQNEKKIVETISKKNQQMNLLKEQYEKKFQNMKTEKINFSKTTLKEKEEKNSCFLIISNQVKHYQQSFNFIVESIQKVSKKTLQKSHLIFQTDKHSLNLQPYLADLETSSSPFLILFYTLAKQLIGVFSFNISIGRTEKEPFQAFIFNATTKKIFESNPGSSKYICPVSFEDNLLVIGNREIYTRNLQLQKVLINCGNIMGPQCFKIKKQELISSGSGQFLLDKVQVHKIWLSE